MRHPVSAILADFNRQGAVKGANKHIGKAHSALFNTKGKLFTDDSVMGTLVVGVTQNSLDRCMNSSLSNNTSLSRNWNEHRNGQSSSSTRQSRVALQL